MAEAFISLDNENRLWYEWFDGRYGSLDHRRSISTFSAALRFGSLSACLVQPPEKMQLMY